MGTLLEEEPRIKRSTLRTLFPLVVQFLSLNIEASVARLSSHKSPDSPVGSVGAAPCG